MKKAEALQLFYEKNHINIDLVSNEEDGNYDARIANLSSQVDLWLQKIDVDDHNIFLELLSRYTYLTEAQCQLRYSRIIQLLNEELTALKCECGLSDVLFVTVESSGTYKSGSDNVRADFQKRHLRTIQKTQIVATQSNLAVADICQYKVVVFIDDIVGSGVTLWNAIKNFCQRFPIVCNGKNNHKLFYACIAPRKHGIKHIHKNCKRYDIDAKELFDAAWYEEPAITKGTPAYPKIKKYEEIIGNYMMSEGESFFMGFKNNRLLLSFHYNTPNNTLSSFWRSVPAYPEPPFYRDGNQPKAGITLDDLQKTKKSMQNASYELGKCRQRKYSDEQ